MTNLFLPIQLLFSVFILFALSRVVLRYKDGKVHFGAMLFWFFIWISAAVAIFSPEKTSELAWALGIGRGVDIVIYLSLILLFYLVFRLHVLLENLESRISQLIREVALKDAKK